MNKTIQIEPLENSLLLYFKINNHENGRNNKFTEKKVCPICDI